MAHDPTQLSAVFKAAWLYHAKGLKQEEVSEVLGISRASVALYLKRARETGMVQVRIEDRHFRGLHQALALEEAYGLSAAYVVPEISGNYLNDCAAATWSVLEPMLASCNRLGVAWGRTLYEIASIIPRTYHPQLDIYQLSGNLGAPYGTQPDETTFLLAKQLGARPQNLHAPLLTSSVELTEALRKEPIIQEHLKAAEQCDIVLHSVGSVFDNSHIVTCGAASLAQIRTYRDHGAVGVLSGRLIDSQGNEVITGEGDRFISVALDSLRKAPTRVLVISGREKAIAAVAALRGGFATHLIIDEPTADAVMAADSLSYLSPSKTSEDDKIIKERANS